MKRKTVFYADPFALKRPGQGDSWCYIDRMGSISVYDDNGFVGTIMPSVVRKAAANLRTAAKKTRTKKKAGAS